MKRKWRKKLNKGLNLSVWRFLELHIANWSLLSSWVSNRYGWKQWQTAGKYSQCLRDENKIWSKMQWLDGNGTSSLSGPNEPMSNIRKTSMNMSWREIYLIALNSIDSQSTTLWIRWRQSITISFSKFTTLPSIRYATRLLMSEISSIISVERHSSHYWMEKLPSYSE